MERTVITWSIPNMLTIGLIGAAWLLIYVVGAQIFQRVSNGGSTAANNSGGY